MKAKIYVTLIVIAILFLIIGVFHLCFISEDYRDSSSKLMKKWDSVIKIAQNAQRDNLNEPIFRLKKIRKEAVQIKAEGGMKGCNSVLLDYMDIAIQSFRMSSKGNTSEAQFFTNTADVKLAEWQKCVINEEKILKETQERVAAAKRFAHSVCFGVGYGVGEAKAETSKDDIQEAAIYNRFFIIDANDMQKSLDEVLCQMKREDLIPFVKNELRTNCFDGFHEGISHGEDARGIIETSELNSALAQSVADTTKKAIQVISGQVLWDDRFATYYKKLWVGKVPATTAPPLQKVTQ